MDYIKNLFLMPFMSFFTQVSTYLPFDLMGMLGLKAAAAIGGGGLTSFNLDALGDSKTPFSLLINGTLTGSATANPTTGFSWMVDADSAKKCGPEGSVIVEQSYVKDAADANTTGTGGRVNFTVKATDKAIKGTTCGLGFKYAQPWNVEKDWSAKPDQMVLITIA